MIAWLGLTLSAWASSIRVHAVIIAHDDVPPDLGSAVASANPGSSAKAVRVVRETTEAYATADASATRLLHTRGDALRFERFALSYASPGLITTLIPDADTAPDSGVERSAPTREGVLEALAQTGCRIARLRGATRSDCTVDVDVWSEETHRVGRAEDVVFVFFSGHGSAAGLMLEDAVLPASTFTEALRGMNADLVVVVLDACFGTGMDPSTGAVMVEPARDLPHVVRGQPGIAVFKSVNTLLEEPDLQSGILTHVMLSGLSGAADQDRDGRITFAEMADFFWLHTERSGQFTGRPEAPGAHPDRVLLDTRQARHALTVDVPADAAARLLFADGEGRAIAEVNAAGAGRRKLVLPLGDEPPQLDLVYLPAWDPTALVREDWSPITDARVLSGLGDDPRPLSGEPERLARYLERTQAEEGLFSRHHLPYGSRRVGRMASVSVGLGYQSVAAYGRIEEADVAAAPEGEAELVAWLRERGVERWNVVSAGATERLHLLGPLHVEAREQLGFTPRAQVSGEPANLLLARGLLGAGLSGYLGSRSYLGTATGGLGVLRVSASAVETFPSSNLPKDDDTPWTMWGGVGLAVVRPGPDLEFGAGVLRDFVRIVGVGGSDPTAWDVRPYTSFEATVAVDLGRWSL
ncbi:MAG: hypothetical protein H6735_22920 [Alphaproteobacteria bacterium]|nr:hypothetical protein [Alphaproteobacteria bacterium]